jgi:hypothetical protein
MQPLTLADWMALSLLMSPLSSHGCLLMLTRPVALAASRPLLRQTVAVGR